MEAERFGDQDEGDAPSRCWPWVLRGRAGSGQEAEIGGPGTGASEIRDSDGGGWYTEPFLCVGRCSESPSDVPHWCSHWILDMGAALSPFACEGMLASWKKSNDKPPRCFKKKRHYFACKGPSRQIYGFLEVMYRCESWTMKSLSAKESMLLTVASIGEGC